MILDLERVAGRSVSRETFQWIEAYASLLREANAEQNLISASTLESLWKRHILDSAQLLRFEPNAGCSWVDIGSGAGLPGIVIASMVKGPITLVEPRRLRAQFLEHVVATLGLSQVLIQCAKIEKIRGSYDVITARAVAPLHRLLGMAQHLSHQETIWVLPKGRTVKSELAEAQRNWHCDVRSEASCTDPDARILVLSNVKAKSKR